VGATVSVGLVAGAWLAVFTVACTGVVTGTAEIIIDMNTHILSINYYVKQLKRREKQ
jgi:hypothetical protein